MIVLNYFRFSPTRPTTQSIRATTVISDNPDPPDNYHPWKPEYHVIVTRQKSIKSMTKDPYTPVNRFHHNAVEELTTESECCVDLIPAKAVTIATVNIKQAPRIIRKFHIALIKNSHLNSSSTDAHSLHKT